jgi:hypothetical protein
LVPYAGSSAIDDRISLVNIRVARNDSRLMGNSQCTQRQPITISVSWRVRRIALGSVAVYPESPNEKQAMAIISKCWSHFSRILSLVVSSPCVAFRWRAFLLSRRAIKADATRTVHELVASEPIVIVRPRTPLLVLAIACYR